MSLDSVLGGLKSYQLKKLQCLSPYSTSPFYPGGLQWAKNAQKGEIENRPWPYFFSQLDPMLFRIFSLKLIKETPCGHQPVNSKFEFYHPPLNKHSSPTLCLNVVCLDFCLHRPQTQMVQPSIIGSDLRFPNRISFLNTFLYSFLLCQIRRHF